MPKKNTRRSTRRTKKKPKYLSLRLQFSSDKPQSRSTDHMPSSSSDDHHHQLDLFPLHPEEKENHDENMAYLLSTSDGGDTTLTGLLTESSSVDINNTDDHQLSPSDSVNYIRYGHDIEAVNLVRTAFRSKERGRSEERYVRYSEVVERRDEEVSSCVGGDLQCRNQVLKPRRLSLKLDYQEIMSAWSDKSPLYIQSDFAQMVPDINDDFISDDISSGLNGGYGNHGGGLWRVPEGNGGAEHEFKIKMEVPTWTGARDEEDGEQWRCKLGGQRQASVLRYKEKRRNRLFAKTIRYEVRKLNAEKRPRIKGRFVKRS